MYVYIYIHIYILYACVWLYTCIYMYIYIHTHDDQARNAMLIIQACILGLRSGRLSRIPVETVKLQVLACHEGEQYLEATKGIAMLMATISVIES